MITVNVFDVRAGSATLAPATLPTPPPRRRLRTSASRRATAASVDRGSTYVASPNSPDGHGPEVTRIRGQFFWSDTRPGPDPQNDAARPGRGDPDMSTRTDARRSAAGVAVSRRRSRPVVRREPGRPGARQGAVRGLPDPARSAWPRRWNAPSRGECGAARSSSGAPSWTASVRADAPARSPRELPANVRIAVSGCGRRSGFGEAREQILGQRFRSARAHPADTGSPPTMAITRIGIASLGGRSICRAVLIWATDLVQLTSVIFCSHLRV